MRLSGKLGDLPKKREPHLDLGSSHAFSYVGFHVRVRSLCMICGSLNASITSQATDIARLPPTPAFVIGLPAAFYRPFASKC